MTRFVNTHRSKGSYGINDAISIERIGSERIGGAFCRYRVACNTPGGVRGSIQFHAAATDGEDTEGPNGLTNETLLAIVADRLECFQAGPNPCQENADAINGIHAAMGWLYQRQDRLARDQIKRDKAERLEIEKPEPAE